MKKTDFEQLMLKYEFAKETLLTELDILIKEYEFNNDRNPVDHVKSRIKTKESAIGKLQRRGYEVNLDNISKHIHDMVGARIICPFISDVYEIVKIIKNSKLFKIQDEDNYIANPKESGYSSYHLNILVPIHLNNTVEYIEAEIQIRTMAMDFWASLDHKMRYKYKKDIPESIKDQIHNVSVDVKKLDDKMDKINDIINENYR